MVDAREDPQPSRIRAVALVSGVSLERDLDLDEVAEHIREPESLTWLDIGDPGQEELSLLREIFRFHPLALEDVARGNQRPKIDEYKEHVFVVTYSARALSDDPRAVELSELNMFVGSNYLVTLHRGRAPELEDAMGRWTRGGVMLREGVGFLVYTVMDAVIDAYFPIVDAIEEEIDTLEMEMLTAFRDESVHALLRSKRTLNAIRRSLQPLKETFHHFLRGDRPLFAVSTRIYFQDVYDHVLRILDTVDVMRDNVGGALDAYNMTLSNRLNYVMKKLTLVSVATAIASCAFGAWGMNVHDIPYTLTSLVFWGAVGFTLILVGLAVAIGVKRGWL